MMNILKADSSIFRLCKFNIWPLWEKKINKDGFSISHQFFFLILSSVEALKQNLDFCFMK